MPVRPIEYDWASAQFPSLFRFFRVNRLRAQVEAFDEIVEAQEYRWRDIDIVFARLTAEINEAHAPLLFAMSSARDDAPSPWHVGAIRFMEECLTRALNAGVTENTYRSMLVSPNSYLDLVGELDWADHLRLMGGDFSPHSPTQAGAESNSNYDLHWVSDGRTLRGDAKCYKDWLVKTRGENLLSGQIKLLGQDLAHDITVKVPARNRTTSQVIEAAEMTLRLYQAAVNNTQDPGWVLSEVPAGRLVRLRAAYYRDEDSPEVPIESVRVNLEPQRAVGEANVGVVEADFGDLEDAPAARRNLLHGASQVPSPTPGNNDVSCIMLGSAAASDSSDVEAALLGRLTVRWPARVPFYDGTGLFDPQNLEPGFNHIGAVFHFSLNFEPVPDHPEQARAVRTCRLFERPNAITPEMHTHLESVRAGYFRDTVINLA